MSLLFTRVDQFKSSLYGTTRNVLRSRSRLAELSPQQAERIRQLEGRIEQLQQQSRVDAQRLSEMQQLLEQEQVENQALRCRPNRAPSDLPLPYHCYGPKMIAMGLNLCKKQNRFPPAGL